MRAVKKNRLALEKTGQEEKGRFESFTLAERRSRFRFRVFVILLGLLFLILVSGGLYYYFQKQAGASLADPLGEGDSLLERLLPNAGQAVKPEYRYYRPSIEGLWSPS